MQSQALSAEQSEWWRLPRVAAETGLSRSTIYRRMDDGTFPRNRAMRSTRAKVWLETEVRDWKRQELTEPAPAAKESIGDLL